jgi:hypothetical protein
MLYRSDRNTLSYKGEDSLILQRCKPPLPPLTHRSAIAFSSPANCSSGEDLGEESGETF